MKKSYQNKDNFLQWFVGFSDAESNFSVVPHKDGTRINKFTFRFTIRLHSDDENSLIFINNFLDIGYTFKNDDECGFIVSNKHDLLKLIEIFDKYQLNTTKFLDFSDFKKAFILYHEREGRLTDLLIDKILSIKNGMNKNRVNFEMSQSHIKITKYWLLGLIEGEGSFQLWRSNLLPVFSIVMTERQLPLFIKIKEFLIKELIFNIYDKIKIENTSVIAINNQKARNNSKGSILLIIKNVNLLYNHLIPYLDGLEFITKKYKDYQDFKVLVKVVYYGGNKDKEIKSIILKLSYNMNNYRLSTSTSNSETINSEEKDKLINMTPKVKRLKDGRLLDILSNKVIHQAESSIYKILNPKEEIFIVQTLREAANIVGVNIKTLSNKLNKEVLDSDEPMVNIKNFKVKRIGVFIGIN
jgi:LAGLIDADG endonuclease